MKIQFCGEGPTERGPDERTRWLEEILTSSPRMQRLHVREICCSPGKRNLSDFFEVDNCPRREILGALFEVLLWIGAVDVKFPAHPDWDFYHPLSAG